VFYAFSRGAQFQVSHVGCCSSGQSGRTIGTCEQFPDLDAGDASGFVLQLGDGYSGFIGTSLQAYEISELGRWGKLHVGLACVRSTLKSGANEKYAGYS